MNALNTIYQSSSPEADLETIEALMEELVLDEAVLEEADAVETEISADEEQAMSLAITKAEVYEASSSADEMIVAEEPADTTVAAKPAKKPRTAKAAKTATPAKVRDLNDLPEELFELTEGDEGIKLEVLAARPSQKKIAEKFDNIFVSMNAGVKPSKYVLDFFHILDAKKIVTTTEMVSGLMALTSNRGAGYTEGTARSQQGQIMELFHVLKIAMRTKNTLTLRDDSVIARWLRKFT